MEIKKYDVTI